MRLGHELPETGVVLSRAVERTQRGAALKGAAPLMKTVFVRSNRVPLVPLPRDARVDEPGQQSADDRRDPEEPELLDRPAADEERGARAPRGVHGDVRHRDADQVDQREAEADRDRREPGRGALVRGAHDDEDEDEREHDLSDQTRRERVAARRVGSVAVRREAARLDVEPGLTARD